MTCYRNLGAFLACGWLLVTAAPGAFAAPTVHDASVLAHWQVTEPLLSMSWSHTGDRILYATRDGRKAHVKVYHTKGRKHVDWGRSLDHFWPSFGPVGTLVGGPVVSPKKAPKKKAKAKKAAAPPKGGRGIYLISRKRQSYLYPGFLPIYSFAARRLLFSFKGLMYVWNPLAKTRKKSLILLCRGYHPRWAHNGRAISFLGKPFSIDAKGAPKGGGLWVVDMLFRAGKINNTGGEQAWSTDSRSLAYVDAYKKPGKPTKTALYYRKLKKGQQPVLLAIGGRHPSMPPRKQTQTKDLIAYHDASGVWIMHLGTRKKKLIAPKAGRPLWSSKGDLAVRYPNAVAILRLAPTLRASLASTKK